ncbi:response regulator [Methylobacterium hispanicum]|uniref:response regulator n=1 Tax=Methylobacterium hispanicum TaxID=270350 RepID=UPI002F35EAC0
MGVDRRENRRAGQGPSPRITQTTITHTAITHTAPLALVVDESPAARDRAALLLAETDLDPITCASGEAAVAVLRRCGDDVALVLTGASLSGVMDGPRLARAVGRHWPGIHLVVGRDEACTLPPEAVRLHRPWLPLDLLVQAHRAARAARGRSRSRIPRDRLSVRVVA